MASPSPYTKRRSQPTVVAPSVSPTQPPTKPTKRIFCKSVLIALFLLALPLFPSQAPDFVGETVFTKFWELIHLLFVGIAVAYGLFSRMNVESTVDLSKSRVDESSLSYVSRIFPISSVFDEDFENSCGLDSAIVEEGKADSFVVESEVEDLSEYGKINQVQAWNSQYFQGRSKLVVARPAYGLDGHVVHQPLGLPVRSLRSALRDNVDGTANGIAESLADEVLDEVLPAPPSPVPWHSEVMGFGETYPSNFEPLSVDETQYPTLKSRSSRSSVSSSSQTSLASHTENRFSPSRSVSEESLNSNVEESGKEKSLQGSSRSTSPSLPLPPSPPLPELVTDDTHSHRRLLHSRHYSDGSLLEEVDVRKGFETELEGRKVRGSRRTEFKTELGSKSLKLPGEISRRGNKSRRSYPPDTISSPTDHSAARRHDLQQKSDNHFVEDNIAKGLETEHNKVRIKKGRSQDSLELTAEDEKPNESIHVPDVTVQPTNAKASRRAMRSSRGNSEDDSGKNKEMKTEPQTWRGSSKVLSRGKSVRTFRSDRHGKDLKPEEEDTSDDRGAEEAKLESQGRIKPRRKWQEDLSIVLHQEKVTETKPKSEPEDDLVTQETEAEEPKVSLEEEEEEAWESQSNASHDHNEVDRKAGEFIAKFREQIRLQKLTSGEQPRGRGGGGGGSGMIRNSHFR